MSIYSEIPKSGSGIRLGIYQAQAAYGPGATEKNVIRLEKAVKEAKKFNVQLLSFPELYIPGYTLSPAEAKKGCSAHSFGLLGHEAPNERV